MWTLKVVEITRSQHESIRDVVNIVHPTKEWIWYEHISPSTKVSIPKILCCC
jgi:hypothetical protein